MRFYETNNATGEKKEIGLGEARFNLGPHNLGELIRNAKNAQDGRASIVRYGAYTYTAEREHIFK